MKQGGRYQARAICHRISSADPPDASREPHPFASGCPPRATLPVGGPPAAARHPSPRATRGSDRGTAACTSRHKTSLPIALEDWLVVNHDLPPATIRQFHSTGFWGSLTLDFALRGRSWIQP